MEWTELVITSKFSDCDLRHFLKVGKMTNAFANGCECFFSYRNADQKNIIKGSIIKEGHHRSLNVYDNRAIKLHNRGIIVPHKWNQIRNVGLLIGALAVVERDTAYTSIMLLNAIDNLPDYFTGALRPIFTGIVTVAVLLFPNWSGVESSYLPVFKPLSE
jgi:hypothetical protein